MRGAVGVAGIVFLFWPEITGAGFNAAALKGLGLCVMGTLFFCSGNMISTVVQRRGVPLLSATAWGMTYGCAVLLALNLLRGNEFIIEPTVKYIGSLLYLAIVRRRPRALARDEEARLYVVMLLIGSVAVCAELIHAGLFGGEEAVRQAVFQVASLMTGTGFAITDYVTWPTLSIMAMIGLMFVGASAGSPTGSVKIVRHLLIGRILTVGGDRRCRRVRRFGAHGFPAGGGGVGRDDGRLEPRHAAVRRLRARIRFVCGGDGVGR